MSLEEDFRKMNSDGYEEQYDECFHGLPKTNCNIPMPDVKAPKKEDNIEEELQNYICDLCDTENISIDLRFACLGDENMFYEKESGVFPIRCEHYHVDNISEVKKLIANTYLVRLWQQAKSYQMIALYIRDIANTGNGYNVVVGGRLIKKSK